MMSQRTPLGISLFGGCAAVLVAGLVAAWIPVSAPVARYVPLVLVLAGYAALTVDATAVALAGALGFAVFDGFLVNRLGELSWHGVADRWRVLALLVAGIGGLAGGTAYRAVLRARTWGQRARTWGQRAEELRTWTGPVPAVREEEWHGV
jgi:hypothetical protein